MKNTPLIMGVLNVTPDSFSDGGQFYDFESALNHASRLIEDGADIIDVGGESSRPGAKPVCAPEEMERVLPVIEAVRKKYPTVRVSIDTRHPEVAEKAILSGATLVNDITAGANIQMAQVVKAHPKVDILLMHMQGNPGNMQDAPSYPRGVVQQVRDFLFHRVRSFEEAGVSKKRIWVDPGIGFGKTLSHNLELLKNLNQFSEVAERLAIGTSRKSFLAKILEDEQCDNAKREAGTLASNLWAYQMGASVFRVHEVGEFKRALKTWEAMDSAFLVDESGNKENASPN